MSPSSTLSLEQAADYLRIPVSELRSQVLLNAIQYSQRGERLFFKQDDLDSWLTQKIIALNSLKPAAQHRERKTLKLPDTTKPFLAELCSLSTVSADLRGRSKPSVLRALSQLAEQSECLYDPNDLYDELLEREEIATTAIEGGAAIPHPMHRFEIELFDDSFICVAKLKEPIFFGDSPDGNKTDIFFLICCLDSNLHIQTIARLCQLCYETSLLQELRQAETDQDMLNILLDVEQHPQNHNPKHLLDNHD